jgi:hypothetical protein
MYSGLTATVCHSLQAALRYLRGLCLGTSSTLGWIDTSVRWLYAVIRVLSSPAALTVEEQRTLVCAKRVIRTSGRRNKMASVHNVL